MTHGPWPDIRSGEAEKPRRPTIVQTLEIKLQDGLYISLSSTAEEGYAKTIWEQISASRQTFSHGTFPAGVEFPVLAHTWVQIDWRESGLERNFLVAVDRIMWIEYEEREEED